MAIDIAALNEALDTTLIENGIYDIGGFGWLGDDSVDEEYVGYAMWWTTPPYEEDFEAWQRNAPPDHEPSGEQEWLMTLGSDFFALMKSARHSLGWMILHRESALREHGAPNAFEYFEVNALVTLNMAADRLRDFAVRAVLHEAPQRGHEFDQWRLAICSARLAKWQREADALEATAAPMADLRKRRNAAVHKIAMEASRLQRERLKAERKARRDGVWPGRVSHATYEAMRYHAERADEEQREALQGRIRALARDYDALVKLGSNTFRIEHCFRCGESG